MGATSSSSSDNKRGGKGKGKERARHITPGGEGGGIIAGGVRGGGSAPLITRPYSSEIRAPGSLCEPFFSPYLSQFI